MPLLVLTSCALFSEITLKEQEGGYAYLLLFGKYLLAEACL